MALKLIINIAKKVPGPQEFSSVQASCSIEGELAAGQDPVAETARLFKQAETAVDAQLAGTPVEQPASAPVSRPTPSPQPTQASRPYKGNGQRRAPAHISPAQTRYLGQLGQRAPGALAESLAQHGVTTIDALTARDASQIIDHMLQVVA